MRFLSVLAVAAALASAAAVQPSPASVPRGERGDDDGDRSIANQPKAAGPLPRPNVGFPSVADFAIGGTRGVGPRSRPADARLLSRRYIKLPDGRLPVLESPAVGGRDGTEFRHVGCRDGATLEKLEVWTKDSAVRGVRLTFYDGEQFAAGTAEDGAHRPYAFKRSERLDSLQISVEAGSTRAGALQFTTTAGGSFRSDGAPGDRPPLLAAVRRELFVRSGFICGIHGRESEEGDVVALGFLFAPEALAVEVDVFAVDYAAIEVEKFYQKFSEYTNGQRIPVYQQGSVDRERSHLGFSQVPTAFAGAEVVFTAKDRLFGPIDAKVYQNDHEREFILKEKETGPLTISYHLSALKRCAADYTYKVGRAYETKWFGVETVHLANGDSFQLPATGNVTGTVIFNPSVEISCKHIESNQEYSAEAVELVYLDSDRVYADFGPHRCLGCGVCRSESCRFPGGAGPVDDSAAAKSSKKTKQRARRKGAADLGFDIVPAAAAGASHADSLGNVGEYVRAIYMADLGLDGVSAEEASDAHADSLDSPEIAAPDSPGSFGIPASAWELLD